MMKVEILSTGDEVCFGSIIDSNAAHIASAISELGIEVTRHSCVGDDMNALVAILSEIGMRADILIATGGLGPTIDDLTASAAATAAGVKLSLNQSAIKYIDDFFAQFKRKMAESDYKQAMLPEGSTPILNRMGTAPGFILTIHRCCCYFLPGVPREMERMLSDQVIPDIISQQGDEKNITRTAMLSIFGLPEASVNDRLKSFTSSHPDVKLGMVARFPIIYVKLFMSGDNEEQIIAEIEKAKQTTVNTLGDYVFSTDGATMESEVGRLLKYRKLTLAVAESCTGGLISHLLTNIPGSSDYFVFSMVTYANIAKTDNLRVSAATIEKFGAVSEETAREMAENIRKKSGASYGLSVSGIAGPTGATKDKPVGTVCIGIAGAEGVISRRFQSPFQERLSNKQIFAICALDAIRRHLSAAS
jgi:nicotinamide-nucleotide amidase